MNKKNESELEKEILKVFNKSNVGTSISDIYNIYKINNIDRNDISAIFQKFIKNNIIKEIPKDESLSRKESYYILNSKEIVELDIDIKKIISFKVNDISISQYQTSLSLNEIQLLAGVKPLKAKGIQRLRESFWVKTISEGLRKSPFPVFFNSLLIYVNERTTTDFNDNKVKFKVLQHQSDFDKPGWLVDGQQRCWALNQLFLEDLLLEPVTLSGIGKITKIRFPTILIIANYEPNSLDEKQFLRFAFKVANSTKNLPKTLIGEILATLDPKYILTDKEGIDQYLSIIRNMLDSEEESPFYNLINLEAKKNLKDSFLSGAVIYSVLRSIYKNYESSEFIHDKNNFFQLTAEYYNIVKKVFKEEWESSIKSKGKDNWLLTRFGLGTFAIILPVILPRSILKSKTRNKTIEETLMKISYESFDFQILENLGFTKSAPDTRKYANYLSLVIEQI